MADNETILINVEFNSEEAARRIQGLEASLQVLKQRRKELQDQQKSGMQLSKEQTKELAQIEGGIKRLTTEQKGLSAQIVAANEGTIRYGDSLNEMRRKLTDMQKTYDNMSQSLRDSSAGEAFKKSMNEQYDAVMKLEAETGRHQRNVGNYPDVFKGAFGKVDGVLSKFGTSVNDLATGGKEAFKGMASGIGSMTKAALKFIATPFGAIITAIVVVVKGLIDAFKKNDAAMTSLQKAFANFEPILTLIRKGFDLLATGIGKALEAISGLIAGESEAAAKAQELVKAQDDLQEAERQYTVNSAKNNKEIQDLRSKAVEKDKYNAAERKKFLEEAIALEKQNLDAELKNKKEKLRLLQETAKQEVDTSDETTDAIAQAQADLYNAEANYSSKTKELKSQMVAFESEITAERQKQADERQARLKEQAEKEKALLEEREKTALEIAKMYAEQTGALIEDETEREIYMTQLQGNAEIEALKARLADKTKLTEEAEQQINELILMKQNEIDSEVARIQSEAEAQRFDEQYNAEEEHLNNMFELRKRQAETDAEVQQIELEQKQEQYDRLAEMDAEQRERMFETEQAYNDALLAAKQDVADAEAEIEQAKRDEIQQTIDKQKEVTEANINASKQLMDSLINLIDATGSEEKSAAVAKKALALGKIAIDTGVALASGIAQSQSVPFPANIAAIATTTATIIANIASAIQTVKSAKFAEGGVVGGHSYEGDKVLARLNSGEVVLNRDQQANLLYQMSNGTNIGNNEAMVASLTSAISAMPSPVMDYTEFTKFESKVSKFDEYATI